MKGKKILTGTLMATMLISSLLTGCNKKDNSNNSSEEITTEAKATSTDTTASADKNDKTDNNTVSSVGTANVDANKKEAESSGLEASNTTNNNKPDTNQQTQTVATANNQASTTHTTQNNQQSTTPKPVGNKVETTEAPTNTDFPNVTPDPIIVVEEPDPTTEASNPDTCTSSYCRRGFTIMSSVPTDGADHGIAVCVNGTHYSRTGHTDYNNILGWNCSSCHENYYGDEWTGHDGAGCEGWENGHSHSTVYGRYYTYD